MSENETADMVAAGLAFSDAAHNWIEGGCNAGDWVAAQRAFADALGISTDRLNDLDRRRMNSQRPSGEAG